jgi:hypothetical protein
MVEIMREKKEDFLLFLASNIDRKKNGLKVNQARIKKWNPPS